MPFSSEGICAEEILMDDQSSQELQLKAVHVITRTSTTYAKLIEASEFEARLSELERFENDREIL